MRWFVKGTEVWNTDSTNSWLRARGTGLIVSDLQILNAAVTLEYNLELSQNKAYSLTQRYWKHLGTHKPAHSCSQQVDLNVPTQTQARGPSAKERANKQLRQHCKSIWWNGTKRDQALKRYERILKTNY